MDLGWILSPLLRRIFLMTAHDSLLDRKRAFAEGADLFLSKPLSREVINMALNSLD
jgi:CheY-like chemotaxis protein